jgi:hypothetical protein
MLSVGPEEGADSTGYLECPIDRQALQRLNVKSPIVKLAVSVFFPMNTLSLSKHLILHSTALLSRAASENKYSINVGAFGVRVVTGQTSCLSLFT